MADHESSAGAELTRAHAMDPRFYFGEDILALENRMVFADSWQLVASAAQLAEPGDHVVNEIAGTPIVVVRGEDGELRAFPNICRHRAGPLALADGKGARFLRCKYHGWTYGLDGQLRVAPEMDQAEDFRIEDICLPRLRVAEWQGLVFVTLGEATPDHGTVYAGIAERIAPIDLAAMRHTHRIVYDVACNWKVYADNFLEGYHVPQVHSALGKALDYRDYNSKLFDWYSLQRAPLKGSEDTYGEGEAFYYFIYPNIALNVMPGRLQTNRILPLGPGRCRVEFDYYYAQDDAAQARIDRDQDFTDAIQREDMAICEAVQRGLASGFYEPGRLCPRHEGGVWHFHNLMLAAYARGGEGRQA